MPASRSPKRGAEPAPRRRSIWPWMLIACAALLAVICAVLPASLMGRFLPAQIHAEDFSGSIWHGSAGRIEFSSRNAGALEWWLHPAALFRLALAADLRWVKGGFAVSATATVDRHGFEARDIKGAGPLADLHELGMAAAWNGTADIDIRTLGGDFSKLSTAVGDIRVANLASPQVAGGSDWGSYALRLAPDAVGGDGSIDAALSDTGGPLQTSARVRVSPSEHTGSLSGTVKERPDAVPSVRAELDGLSQLRGRDAQGRIPVDLEFTF